MAVRGRLLSVPPSCLEILRLVGPLHVREQHVEWGDPAAEDISLNNLAGLLPRD
jgi:hypothetical protein